MNWLKKIFKRKETDLYCDQFQERMFIIVMLVNGLTRSHYEKLKEVMDMVYDASAINQKVKTPDQIIEECGGFLLHEKDGIAK